MKLLGTSALLVVTRTLVATKKLLGTSALLSNKDASS